MNHCVKKNEYLNRLKVIYTILIVLYHIPSISGNNLSLFIKNLGDSVVPGFALVSGYLFFYNVNNFYDIKRKMIKRLYTLLIPYLLWNLINTIGLNIINILVYNKSILDIEINLLTDIIYWKNTPHFWYVFMLIFFTIFSPVLYFLYKSKYGIVALLLIQIVYIYVKGNNILHSRFTYILYTWGGVVSRCKKHDLDYLISFIKNRLFVNFSGLVYVLISLIIIFYPLMGMQIKVWLYLFKNLSLMVILYSMNSIKFNFFNDYLFYIFAVHYWIDVYVHKILIKVYNGILTQILTFVIVIIFSLLSGMILKNKFNNLYHVLTGNREYTKNKY